MKRSGGSGRWFGYLLALLVIGVVVTTLLRVIDTDREQDSVGSVAGSRSTHTSFEEFDGSGVTRPPQRLNDSVPSASAKALYVIDVGSAYPLYAQNEDAPVPIASTTKLMTALVVLEKLPLETIVTVSQEAAATGGSDIQLVWGEELTVDSLLKGLLIQSGNDAAMALAEHVGFGAFVEAMNIKAATLGMTDTLYHDPAGLDDTGYSTARDLGILAVYALRNDVIRSVVGLTDVTITSIDGRFSHRLETSNRLIKQDHPLFLATATGLKTGFTPEAGHCLVASASQDGHTVISVVLNTSEQTVEASAKESRKLLTWALDNFTWE